MGRVKAMGRLGGLAIGLGIGAALAASPGVASAAPDIDISFDGMDIFHTAGHTAVAESGMNDFAIAIGTGSFASAASGQFDTAFADGTNSIAQSGDGNFDSAFASGIESHAAGGGSGSTLSDSDFASAFGTKADAFAGVFGAPSANDTAVVFDPFGSTGSIAEAGNGNFDFASIFGDNSLAQAGFIGNFDLASVFGDMLHASATGGNYLIDILPAL